MVMLRDRENPSHLLRAVQFVGAATAGFVDLLYPPLCLHCQARVAPGAMLCRACRNRLEPVGPDATAHLLERLETTWIDEAVAVWYFDKGSPLQAVQHALKYGNRPVCGWWMGAHLARVCASTLETYGDLIVPVPLHRSRLLERGYNQSMHIASALGDALNLAVRSDLVTRTRATQSQTSLSRADRRKNLSDVFAAHEYGIIDGKHIIIVDDVITTGATLESVAITLKDAGARRVTAAAIGLARN